MLLVFKVMLARAQSPHIFFPKSLIAVLLLNAPSDLFQSLYLLLSKALLDLFFSKPRAKIRLFMRVGVEKLTKKQHNFLLDKKLCFLIVPIDIVGSIDAIVSISLFPLFKTSLRRCTPLASGSIHSACAHG